MKFNEQTFEIVKVNKKNALLWGQKMWFILTNVYKNSQLDKYQTHNLWIENIALALIYKEFTIASTIDNSEIDWVKYLKNLDYQWSDQVLIYYAGRNNFHYSKVDEFDETKRFNLIIELIYLSKKDIFYSLVKHYFSTNSMYEELENSIKDENYKLPQNFDNIRSWEWAREEFSLMKFENNENIEDD